MSGVSNSYMNSTSNYLLSQMMGNRQAVQKWDKNSIAEHLWKDPGAPIEDEIVNKVNIAKTYVEGFGHVLQGVAANGDCFFSAFLESYRMLSRQIPILNDQEDKVTYLRGIIAQHLQNTNFNRSLEIREKGRWISSGEGEFLAKALSIHIRIITVNLDQDGNGLDDVIVFPDIQKPSQQWENLTEAEKPDEYVFIVDLGGHFIWAKNPNQVYSGQASTFITPPLDQRYLQSDDRSLSEDFSKKRSFSDSSIPEDHPAKQTRFGDDEERDEKASMLLAMEEYLRAELKEETLSFYNQKITDQELIDKVIPKLLAQGQKLAGVRVDLRFNMITAKGIAELVKIPYLTNLDISYNPIGDEGAVILAKSTTLRRLDVNQCDIGPEGAWAFVSNTSIIDGLFFAGTQLGSKWRKSINRQLENNKSRSNPQYAKELEDLKAKKALEKRVMKAIKKERIDLLPSLVASLEAGINTKLEYGCTLLSCAVEEKSVPSVEVLLKMGARLEEHEREYTPLFKAAEKGYLAIVKLLLNYGSNITGEFFFNNETALSIAAYKLSITFMDVLREHMGHLPFGKELAQKMLNDMRFLNENSDRPLELFSKPEDLGFPKTCLSFFNELRELNPEIGGREMVDRAEIFVLLEQKFQILHEQVPSTAQDGYATDEDDMLTHMHEVEPVVRPTEQYQNLTRQQLQVQIDRLNLELKQGKTEADIDWSTYPRFFIAQYRGIHYYRHHFSKAQRADHRSTSHLNRIAPAPAVYFMSNLTPKAHQLARESEIRVNAEVISDTFEELAKPSKTTQYWGDKKHIFQSPSDMLQQRMSNAYASFGRDIANPTSPATKLLFDQRINKGYPHYATSDLPMHALRYAFGQKPIEGLTEWRLRPVFQENGKATHPYPGKLFITMFTPLQMHLHGTRHVAGMHNRNSISLQSTVAPERETSIPGGVDPEISVYEELQVIPSFEKYDENYQEKYGISESKFAEYKKEIELSLTHPEEKEKDRIRKHVKNEIIQSIIEYKERELLKLALNNAKRMGGYLIFRHFDGEYGVEFEKMRTPQRAQKHSYTQREEKLLEFLRAEYH